jgi:hypothetical protein
MEIIAFVVIACIWAAFLLPSFFESRRTAPLSTTRSFARSTALLATVASSTGTELMARRRARDRRRRILLSLASAALISLTIAIVRSSIVWLGLTLAFDVAIAAYVTLLLQARQRTVVPLISIPNHVAVEEEPQRHTVRVVAG